MAGHMRYDAFLWNRTLSLSTGANLLTYILPQWLVYFDHKHYIVETRLVSLLCCIYGCIGVALFWIQPEQVTTWFRLEGSQVNNSSTDGNKHQPELPLSCSIPMLDRADLALGGSLL